jgi:hypothetical protein
MSAVAVDEQVLRLFSTDEAAALAGVTPMHLHRWAAAGEIVPHQPASGTGSRRQWSGADVDRLARIGAVYHAALEVGIILPPALVGEIWDGLRRTGGWSLTLTA